MLKKFRHKGKAAVIAMAVVLTLAGCGSNAEKTTTADANKSKTYELTVGYGQGSGAPLYDIAEREGFFNDEHLKVKGVGFASSADGLNGLQAGKIDIGLSSSF